MNPQSPNVARLLTMLKLGYPSYRPDERSWAGMVALWSSRLGHHRPEVLHEAARAAHKAHPDWMPTLPQVEAICGALAKTSLGRPVTPRSHRLTDGHAPPPRRELDPGSPYEELARRWEASPPTAGDAGAVAELVGRLAGGGR